MGTSVSPIRGSCPGLSADNKGQQHFKHQLAAVHQPGKDALYARTSIAWLASQVCLYSAHVLGCDRTRVSLPSRAAYGRLLPIYKGVKYRSRARILILPGEVPVHFLFHLSLDPFQPPTMSTPNDHADFTSYRASGFSNRIGWGQRPALLLIDVCTAYWTPGSPLDTSSNPASMASVDGMQRLLAVARESKVPVIWTQVAYQKGLKDAGLFSKKASVLSVWEEG